MPVPLRFIVATLLVLALCVARRRDVRAAAAESWSAAVRHMRAAGPVHLAALVTITVAAVIARLHFLNGPMRWDESYSFLNYGIKRWSDGLSFYDSPNNHLFHSMLVHVSYVLFGAGHRAVRGPAFLAGVLIPIVVYVAALRSYGRQAALVAAALSAGSAQMIEYSTNARGYSMVALFSVSLLVLAPELLRSTNRTWWGLFSIVAALGFYTQPVYTYPFLGVVLALAGAALLGQSTDTPARFLAWLAGSTAAAVGLAAWLYGPVLDDAVHWLTHGSPYSKDALATFRAVWNVWTLGLPTLAVGVLVLGFVLSVFMVFPRRSSHVPLALAVSAIPLGAALTHHVPIYPRYWFALLPLAVIPATGGLLGWTPVRRMLERRWIDLGISIAAVAIGIWVVHVVVRDNLANAEGSMLPSAHQIAELVGPRLTTNDELVVSVAGQPMEAYELFRLGFNPSFAIASMTPEQTRAGRTYVVVNKLANETLASTLKGVAPTAHLKPRGKELARFPGADVYELLLP